MYNVLHYFNHFICVFSKFTNHISSISSLVPFEMDRLEYFYTMTILFINLGYNG
jgi:hypothetical protein